MEGRLQKIRKLHDILGDIDGEDLIIVTHAIGALHAHLLERIEPGLSEHRNMARRKVTDKDKMKCRCGGSQKARYTIKETNGDKRPVCQRCYRIHKEIK